MSSSNKTQTHKKRKTPSSSSSSPSFQLSSLPDEMALSCLARVSRSDHIALSRVSKTYRSLLSSPELYKTRSLLRCTENCIYVCLHTPPDPTPHWFILLRRPGFLIPIPSFQSQAPERSSVVALDWGIYVIGGLIKGKPTSDVLFLDCRTHTWRKLPSMRAARSSAMAGDVGGKIYVFGGFQDPDSLNWAEVFDPRFHYIRDSLVMRAQEKVYEVDLMERNFYYWRKLYQLLHGYVYA